MDVESSTFRLFQVHLNIQTSKISKKKKIKTLTNKNPWLYYIRWSDQCLESVYGIPKVFLRLAFHYPQICIWNCFFEFWWFSPIIFLKISLSFYIEVKKKKKHRRIPRFLHKAKISNFFHSIKFLNPIYLTKKLNLMDWQFQFIPRIWIN